MTDLSGQTKSCAPDCNFNKYSAFRTSEKQPPLISDQRPISRSHLAQNTYIRLSMSDQRPHLLKIWETAAMCKLTKKKSILHYFYSIQFCLGQKRSSLNLAESLILLFQSSSEEKLQEIICTGQQVLLGKITWLVTKIKTGVVCCQYRLKQSPYSGKFTLQKIASPVAVNPYQSR